MNNGAFLMPDDGPESLITNDRRETIRDQQAEIDRLKAARDECISRLEAYSAAHRRVVEALTVCQDERDAARAEKAGNVARKYQRGDRVKYRWGDETLLGRFNTVVDTSEWGDFQWVDVRADGRGESRIVRSDRVELAEPGGSVTYTAPGPWDDDDTEPCGDTS